MEELSLIKPHRNDSVISRRQTPQHRGVNSPYDNKPVLHFLESLLPECCESVTGLKERLCVCLQGNSL